MLFNFPNLMTLKLRLSFFLILAVATGSAFAARGPVLMVIPEPISIPAKVSEEGAATALRSALAGRDWHINSESPGQIEATLNVRQHSLKMHFSYDGGAIAMRYVDSTALGYTTEIPPPAGLPRDIASGGRGTSQPTENGPPRIHPNVMNWLDYVTTDIKANLAKE